MTQRETPVQTFDTCQAGGTGMDMPSTLAINTVIKADISPALNA